MRRTPPHAGFTLLELVIVLAVLGVLVALALPPLRRGLDAFAVRSARDVIVASIARARVAAVAHGGARLVVDPRAAEIRIERSDGRPIVPPTDLARRYGVRFAAAGAEVDSIEVRFDALGIGRSLGASVGIRRGAAEAGLTIAAYGRVRKW